MHPSRICHYQALVFVSFGVTQVTDDLAKEADELRAGSGRAIEQISECFIGDAGDMHLAKERDQIFLNHNHIVAIDFLATTFQLLVHCCDAQLGNIRESL